MNKKEAKKTFAIETVPVKPTSAQIEKSFLRRSSERPKHSVVGEFKFDSVFPNPIDSFGKKKPGKDGPVEKGGVHRSAFRIGGSLAEGP